MNSVFGNNASNVGNSNYSLLAHSSNLVISQPEDAVTFIDNHDTGSTQKHWYLDPSDIGTAYAFILTHPGVPCVAWQHYFTYAESGSIVDSQQYIGGNTVSGTSNTYRKHIDYLIDLRNRIGIEYDDTVKTDGTSNSCYVGEIVGNNGTILVKIGNVTAATGTGYAGNDPIYSGTNFAIWEKDVDGDATISGNGSGSGSSGGESFTLNFTNKAGWGEPYAYYFDDYGTVGPDWPGTKMTFVETNDYGEKVYSTVTEAEATHVIFTDGNNQTVNILLDSSVEGYYTDGGTTKNNEGKTIYTVKKWGE